MAEMLAALPKLVAGLGDGEESDKAAATAIMTTDLAMKSIAMETDIGGKVVRVGAMGKGSGMIHPDMATMLAFLTCDAAVPKDIWQGILSRAADRSFNQITVDGDTSTNDALIGLANGAGTVSVPSAGSPEAAAVEDLVTQCCQYIARCVARDGEGATVLIEVRVSSAPDDAAARRVAKTVCGSALFKAAMFGRDPNWGRITAAAGRAGVEFEQEKLGIRLGEFELMKDGQPVEFDAKAASEYLGNAAKGAYLTDEDTVVVEVDLGAGEGKGVAWGCDLSYDYVKINAEYTT